MLILILVGIGGLLLRLSHFPADIPIRFDAMGYFWYASDVAILGSLPLDYTPANNGWPIFLSIFFQVMDSSNYMDYMLVQRLAGVALSVLTVIPVYLICRRFFPAKYALIGPAIFVFEPRVAANSFLGVTEPLYVLLIAMSVACFLSERKRVIFATFPIIAAAAMVRGEAVALIVPYAILYGIRFRHSKKTAYEIPLLVILFVLILTPMITYRIDVNGTDAMFMRIIELSGIQFGADDGISPSDPTSTTEQSQDTGQTDRFRKLIASIMSSASISSIPVIIFLIPYGLYRIFRNMKMENVSIMTILFFMAVPAFYALTTAFAPRYLFLMIPILCIFCIISVKKLADWFPRKDLALIVITVAILASSVIIAEDRRIDIEHEKEAIQIAGIISEKIDKINLNIPEGGYFTNVGLQELDEFPILKNEFERRGSGVEYCSTLPVCDYIGRPSGEVAEFFKNAKKDGITHLVIDDVKLKREQIMIDIFQNENQYPYLMKIYDSKHDGFEYQVKIFEIDYEKFEEMDLNGN